MGMAHTWNTLRAKDARHRVAFRTFSPIFQAVLAPTCALTGGVSYAGLARYGPRHTSRSSNHSMTSARMPSERRRLTSAGNLQASHPSASSARVIPWGKAGQAKNSSGVTILTPETDGATGSCTVHSYTQKQFHEHHPRDRPKETL